MVAANQSFGAEQGQAGAKRVTQAWGISPLSASHAGCAQGANAPRSEALKKSVNLGSCSRVMPVERRRGFLGASMYTDEHE